MVLSDSIPVAYGACGALPITAKAFILVRPFNQSAADQGLDACWFELAGGRMGCYAPPLTTEKWFRRFDFMEEAGTAGGRSPAKYFLHGVKRVRHAHHHAEMEVRER